MNAHMNDRPAGQMQKNYGGERFKVVWPQIGIFLKH